MTSALTLRYLQIVTLLKMKRCQQCVYIFSMHLSGATCKRMGHVLMCVSYSGCLHPMKLGIVNLKKENRML